MFLQDGDHCRAHSINTKRKDTVGTPYTIYKYVSNPSGDV